MSAHDESLYEARAPSSPSDVAEVTDFMKKHFYPGETIFKSLLAKRRPTNEEMTIIGEDQSRIVELMVLNSPCIAIAHRPSRRIVAMSMLIGASKDDETRHFNVYAEYSPKSKLVDDYVNGVAKMIDAAGMPYRSAIEIDMLAVDPEHARRGLAARILRESCEYARNNGFEAVDGLFTSGIARKAAERVGMRSLMDYEVNEWFELEGVEDVERRASLMVLGWDRDEGR